MSSSNRSHRPQPGRPSLKQRAADLEAGLARVSRRSVADTASSPVVADQAFGADAVHALVAEHRAAYAEWDRLAAVWNEMTSDDPAYAAARAALAEPGKREIAAFDALLSAQPTTLSGATALASYLVEAVGRTRIDAEPTDGERALGTVAAALRRLELSRMALADVGLTSEISKDVFAAIEDHRDIMEATIDPSEDDGEFDRQAEMQNAAERTVAHAPVRSLADLRAKLTYLIPIIAPDMLDRTHVAHLQVVQADMDRLCRERSRPADNDEGAELLRLGEQLDRAHARWRVAVERYREPEARLQQALEAVRAQGGPRPGQLEAAWNLPGVEEAHTNEERAFDELDPICAAIWRLPAATPAGLAVKARAALVHIWPRGEFEADAADGEEETLAKASARRLIEACCTLAGVDWRGDPIAPPAPQPRAAAVAPVKSAGPAAENGGRSVPNLVGMLDLASASMDDLQSLHDVADLVGGAAYATAWTARCMARGHEDELNIAGKLMQWLGEALTDVETAAEKEAARRVPNNRNDRETRLSMLAAGIIENGDPEGIEELACELLAHAKVERGEG